ncbi:serine/threonine protein kinase [Desulfosudis oleivorans]|uniref:Serine/threonine protein kinase n=1 Tax=Desulfosudis oleivorans (strain DSM 6200 / JCM 39069 / Hxd3) TaxID=96561 RepID=A8ZU52_DESOH|nr:serine/threonine-protein kinase [Desulfosudis oleivorans]ABW66364.1 serine/threonine protein kinase [Desulfosudis oleivorans Hxd3]
MAKLTEVDLSHLLGREVGTSTLLKELDRGAMAVVFVAFQRTLKRQIAVKILPKSILTPETAALFVQEAEMAAILSHPNIIQVYEVGETDEFLYFTMQLIQGNSLAYHIGRVRDHVIPSKRFLPVSASLDLVRAMLDALDYAHGQDIVHRDVKPSNVLIEPHTQRPILMDFGISKSVREPGAAENTILGTPVNMAPEQILGKEMDNRVDVYGAGVLLFQSLVSNLPLAPHESTRELLKLKLADRMFIRPPSAVNPAVHSDMDEIVVKATAFHPRDRYGSCREFADALKHYAANHLQADR